MHCKLTCLQPHGSTEQSVSYAQCSLATWFEGTAQLLTVAEGFCHIYIFNYLFTKTINHGRMGSNLFSQKQSKKLKKTASTSRAEPLVSQSLDWELDTIKSLELGTIVSQLMSQSLDWELDTIKSLELGTIVSQLMSQSLNWEMDTIKSLELGTIVSQLMSQSLDWELDTIKSLPHWVL